MQYRLIAKNGVCKPDTSSVAAVRLFSTPFPQSLAEPSDTTICFGGTATLNAIVNIGTNYTWVTTFGISNQGNGIINGTPYSIRVTSSPLISSNYILNIANTGCPNLLSDTFHVQVRAPIIVNATHDTSVVYDQPLQLNASSSDPFEDTYNWTPPTGLNNANIPDPIAILSESIDSVRYVVRATAQTGCFGTATVRVKVFKTLPDIFVPNAFTPGRAVNAIFRPIPVGISSLLYFKVYNRWGELMYSTSQIGAGWDGLFGGKPQSTQTFVWMVAGVTYNGKTIVKKGTVTLIR
jgi:gliding motility-associated-like protein